MSDSRQRKLRSFSEAAASAGEYVFRKDGAYLYDPASQSLIPIVAGDSPAHPAEVRLGVANVPPGDIDLGSP
jgi:hypothetical protein